MLFIDAENKLRREKGHANYAAGTKLVNDITENIWLALKIIAMIIDLLFFLLIP